MVRKCDGSAFNLNSKKEPECADHSDESLEVCCKGNYSAYNNFLCHDLKFVEKYNKAPAGTTLNFGPGIVFLKI